MQPMGPRTAIAQSSQALAAISGNPFANGPRADACGFADGLRRLPARNLPYNSLSTVRGQTGILVHVHPVLPWNPKSQQLQLPRSEPDGQPAESSHLEAELFLRPRRRQTRSGGDVHCMTVLPPKAEVDLRSSYVAPQAAHSLLRFPRFESTAPPERHGIHVSCGSRANEAGVNLSEPRPPLWLDCSSANALSPKVPSRS